MIQSLTPCPCLDRILSLSQRLRRGRLHRVQEVEELAGGKGLNLARAVVRLGGEAEAVAFLGGYVGARVRELAAEEGLPLVALEAERTRACQILSDPSATTEVYEPCPPAGRGLLDQVAPVVRPEALRVLSGSLPPGLPPEELLAVFRPHAVDSLQAFAPALALGVPLIKPNRAELRSLVPGRPLEAGRRLFRRYGVALLVSLGEEGLLYVGKEGSYRAFAPRRPGNPVASGDTLLGAFLLARERGEGLVGALRFAAAAAAANVGRGGGRVSPEEVARLLPQVEVEEA